MGLESLYASRAGGKRWVEQTPSYTMVAEQLALMFPTAQFLFLIRDGRQVTDSMRRMWEWDIPKAAGVWKDHTQTGLSLQQQYPDRVMQLRYESLVSQPEPQFMQIFEFLGLENAPESAAFMQGRPINTSPGTEDQSAKDKLKPRWHSWGWSEKRQCNKSIGPLLSKLGYD